MSALKVLRIGPAVSVQDQGRPGMLERGISQGGCADLRALAEGAALLGQSNQLAALEMGGVGGRFEVTGRMRIALTGAPMAAFCDGVPLTWNASHSLDGGQCLEIGGAMQGVYGYLHVGGGIDSPVMLGSRAVHLAAGLGQRTQVGDCLTAGADSSGDVTGLILPSAPYFDGGDIRILPSFQTELFSPDTRARFAETVFLRGARANRMGVELAAPGLGFAATDQLNILSEIIVPGDVQMTGSGQPFVLMRECQTTGGYPRIGTVLPCDLSKIAQAGQGASFRFRWVDRAEAEMAERQYASELATLAGHCRPAVRDLAGLRDLLSHQLISGAVSANADPFDPDA